MKFLFSFCFLLFFSGSAFSQWGIILDTEEAVDGYTLFKISGQATYLINNCGEVVHTWDATGGLFTHPKLLDNGNIIYTTNSNLSEYSWDGQLLNSVSTSQTEVENFTYRYEVVKLENGNYLSVGRISKSDDELDDLGFDLSLYSPSETDVVVEVDSASGQVVWLWDIADHMIQERDSTKGNFGSIFDHPELLDMDAISRFDWNFGESFMINGMDYNPDLDQIALSVRKMSEIIIIDHSTTTEEAQGSIGGNSGKGGDVLYRWGNQQNYSRGTDADRYLFFQHNPKWILEGPHKNKLSCFNNGLNRPNYWPLGAFSEAPLITTSINADGEYELLEDSPYMPIAPDVVYAGNNPSSTFYSPYTSGAQIFANGNVFISEGINARLLEVNSEGEVVWEYKVPSNDYLFRAEKYESTHPAFEGKDLIPTGIEIPFTDTPYECGTVSVLDRLTPNQNMFSLQQFSNKSFTINNLRNDNTQFQIVDLQGQLMRTYYIGSHGSQDISLDGLSSSLYILSAIDKEKGQIQSQKLIIY